MEKMPQNMFQEPMDASPYLTIREFAIKYSTFTESSIRWLIYNNTENFNEAVVRRVGKNKILISVRDFWKWIEDQNQQRKGTPDEYRHPNCSMAGSR